MFNTYGVEDLLMASFQRHYENLLKSDLKKHQKMLDNGSVVTVGKMRIGNLLSQIVKEHGAPQNKNYPKMVEFGLVSPNSPKVGKENMYAYFNIGELTGNLYIVKVAKKIQDVKFDDEFKTALQHELQHLISDIYNPYGLGGTSKTGTIEYYSLAHEIQAFCAGIARKAFNSWKEIFEYALLKWKWKPEKVLTIIQNWKTSSSLSNLVNTFLLSAFRDFDISRSKIISSNQDLKKKYLYYSIRNFEMLLTRYLNDLETKTKAQLNENL